MKEKNYNKKDFYFRVYETVRKIPQSRVTTYGLIARYLGDPRSSRMVGWAMNKSHHVQPPVPAHRVVNRNGNLTGKHHFGGEHIMKDLLISEGITVKNDQVQDFKKILWDPSKEI